MKGVYGAVMKAVLHTFINDDESFCHVGIAMDVGSGPCLMYAKPWKLLADGAALTACFDTTGASGTKSCFCCSNAMKAGTFDEEEVGQFVEITCADPEKFILHTNESVWKSVDDLTAIAPTVNKTQLKRIQQCYGFKANPDGMLRDMPLREFVKPVDFYTHDWPHIFLQHGVGNIQMYHLFENGGVEMEELRNYVDTWKLPEFRKHLRKNAKQVFQANRRDTKEKYWKCSISEFLLVAPMVLNFITRELAHLPDEVDLFAQLCFILDLIRAMKQGNMGLTELLDKSVQQHFKNTVRIHGSDILISKHHSAAVHLARQFAEDGIVLDTVPVERMHQVPKGFGSVIKNLDIFEKSVLVRCIAHQRIHLEQFDDRTRLIGPIHDEDDYKSSKTMYVEGLTIAANDVILVQAVDLVVVEWCGQATANDAFFLVGKQCDRINETRGAAIIRPQAGDTWVWLDSNHVQDVKGWRELANGNIEVLLPLA